MTRDEFIDGYMQRSGIPATCRTPEGFRLAEGVEQTAVPCDCREPGCHGWAMVNPRSLSPLAAAAKAAAALER